MCEKHQAISGLFLAVAVAVLTTGCSASSGTAKTEALIANVMRDDGRDNLALNSRILAMSNTATSLRDYGIGPGDLLEVSIFDIPELTKIRARVSSEGFITLPLVGTVAAGEKTAMELEETLKTALASKYIRNPQVSVFLLEYHSQKISVLGAVKKPGVFEVSGPRTLVDMLSMAEGLTEQADQVVYLMRKVAKASASDRSGSQQEAASNGKSGQEGFVEINLDDLLVEGKEDLNIRLLAGDVVHVPKAGSVFVGGSVYKPGAYFLKGRAVTVDQAIIEAGGVSHVADFENVKIFRERGGQRKEIIEVNLSDIEQGKKGPLVMKNDVILVGKDGVKAFWFGVLDFIRVGVGKTF